MRLYLSRARASQNEWMAALFIIYPSEKCLSTLFEWMIEKREGVMKGERERERGVQLTLCSWQDGLPESLTLERVVDVRILPCTLHRWKQIVQTKWIPLDNLTSSMTYNPLAVRTSFNFPHVIKSKGVSRVTSLWEISSFSSGLRRPAEAGQTCQIFSR